jgi:hypothetical protein
VKKTFLDCRQDTVYTVINEWKVVRNEGNKGIQIQINMHLSLGSVKTVAKIVVFSEAMCAVVDVEV